MLEFDPFLKFGALVFSVGILALALLFKTKTKSWTAPSVLFALFWFLFTFFPLLIMFTVPINPFSILYILSAVFVFGLPSLFIGWEKNLQENKQKIIASPMLYNGRFLSLCFFGMQLSVLLCILMNLKTQGYQPEEFVNDLFGTAYRYLNDRYNGRIIPNIYAQIGIVLNYTGVCIGGIVITTRKGLLGKLVVFILSFVPAALHMAIYADKGTLFLCAALFYGGVLLTRIHKGDTSLTNRQTNKVFLMCFVLLLPVLLASFMARGIDEGSNEEAVKKLLFYIASYAFGHLYAFSDWFSNLTYGNSMNTYFHQEHYTNGLFTFMSIFKTLGLPANVPDGYYDEYYNYRNIIQSNIYTVFRGAIQDFSFFGSYLYILLTGAVTNFAYHRVLTTRFPVISGAVFICTMGYIYSSFLISIMVWNSIFAVFVALVLLLSINKGLYKFSPYKIDTALATKHGLIKQGSAP